MVCGKKSMPIRHVFSCPLTIKGDFEAKKDPLKERFIQILIFRASPLTIKGCFWQKRVGLSRNYFLPSTIKGEKRAFVGSLMPKIIQFLILGKKEAMNSNVHLVILFFSHYRFPFLIKHVYNGFLFPHSVSVGEFGSALRAC